jgi:hypothetical protein
MSNLMTPSCARRRIALLTFGIVLNGSFAEPVAAQAGAAEYELKATFIYNLVRFVDWPEGVFPSASDPLRLVVVGHDPFNGALDRVVAGKTVNGRSMLVVHSASGVTAPPGNIVFLAASEEKGLAKVLARYCHSPVLTLSDIHAFAARGGVVGLVMVDKVVHFSVNRTAAEEAGLRISAQMYHLAVPLFSAISPCK